MHRSVGTRRSEDPRPQLRPFENPIGRGPEPELGLLLVVEPEKRIKFLIIPHIKPFDDDMENGFVLID